MIDLNLLNTKRKTFRNGKTFISFDESDLTRSRSKPQVIFLNVTIRKFIPLTRKSKGAVELVKSSFEKKRKKKLNIHTDKRLSK